MILKKNHLQTVQEWNKSDIELIALYVHPNDTNLVTCKSAIYTFYTCITSEVNSSMRRSYFSKLTYLRQNAVFDNFAGQIVSTHSIIRTIEVRFSFAKQVTELTLI